MRIYSQYPGIFRFHMHRIYCFTPPLPLLTVNILLTIYRLNVIVCIQFLCLIDLGLIPARYILAILGSIAMAIVYGLKVNLSVAMVAMLNHTALKQSSDIHNTVHTVIANATKSMDMDSCSSDTATSATVEVIQCEWYLLM